MKRNENTRRGFLWLTFIFSIFSVLLIAAAWYASGITPDLMQRNYRSIQYASAMESSLVAIFLDGVDGKLPAATDLARFAENLELERNNFTEEREAEIVQNLADRWAELRAKPVSPSIASFKAVSSAIDELVAVNEKAMLAFEQRALSLRYSVIAGSILGFVLVLLYAWQVAEWHRVES